MAERKEGRLLRYGVLIQIVPLLIAFVTYFFLPSREEICCKDGLCFNNDPPFDDLPLPKCPEDIRPVFKMYTRETRYAPQLLKRDLIPEAYNNSRTTIFIVHGYMPFLADLRNPAWLTRLKGQLIDKFDANVVIVHWPRGSQHVYYPTSASNTRSMGAELALISKNLVVNGGADRAKLWCVGHSLGAHLCGHAGMQYKLGRITGLDPAGPGFEDKPVDIGLNQNCAQFVDVWHTHGKRAIMFNLGTMRPLGHVDFYPNGGGSQPGCRLGDIFSKYRIRGQQMKKSGAKIDLLPDCSHMRVLDLFEESVSSNCQFTSTSICTEENHIPENCERCGQIMCQTMGPQARSHPGRGIFYLQTNAHSPFCMS